MLTKKFLFSLIVVLMVSINYTNVVILAYIQNSVKLITSFIPITLSRYIIFGGLIFLILSLMNSVNFSSRESLLKVILKMVGYFIVFTVIFLISTVLEISIYYRIFTDHNLFIDVLSFTWSAIIIEIIIGVVIISTIEFVKVRYNHV